jgi:transcriptional regulator with XRE-family HTH domain
MLIGERLKALREERNMSQGDIEKLTGLLPAMETLEKFARALQIPMYALFYDGKKPPKPLIPAPRVVTGWGSSGRDAKTLHTFRRLLKKMDQGDVKLLLFMAQKMARRKKRGAP